MLGKLRGRAASRGFVLPAVVVVLTLASGLGMRWLDGFAQARSEGRVELLRVEALAFRLSAAEDRAVAVGQVTPETLEGVDATIRQMDESLGRARAAVGDDAQIRRIQPEYVQYQRVMREMLHRVEEQKIPEARNYDMQTVDGVFDTLLTSITQASEGYRQASARADRTRVFGGIAILTLLCGLVLALIRRGQQTHHRHASALAHQASHDYLTGLANRRQIIDLVGAAMQSVDREPGDVFLLYVDLDDFKAVNDQYGHDIGDALLQEVAARLRAGTREDDVVARLGGDEFTVLLGPHVSSETAELVAQRLTSALREPIEVAGRVLRISASIGLAHCVPGQHRPEDIFRHADAAMYDAKRRGKRQYAVWGPELAARLHENLGRELHEAVEGGQLELLFQPWVDLRTGQPDGVEALVRWRHPSRGLLGPLDFIPMAEELGLIDELGEWVLRTACRASAGWRSIAPNLTLAVNVSTRQLDTPGFEHLVRQALEQGGLQARLLTLEMTESAMLEEASDAAHILTSLTELGVRVAVDDFGVGFSSLDRVRRMPVHTLKIDRSFVRDIVTDPQDAALVDAVIGMGRSLGLDVIAEGIETEEQEQALRRLGCPKGQGYLFARPVPAADLLPMLLPRQAAVPAPIQEPPGR